MTEPTKPTTPAGPTRAPRRMTILAAVAGAAIVGGGGLLMAQRDDTSLVTPLPPTAIAKLDSSSAIAAKGKVAEIFGNKFILQDDSGRTLIDTGPSGEGANLVAKDEPVSVQGRFENGEFHAAILTHGDGRRVVLGPMGPRPGPLERAKERVGIWPTPDVPALTALVQSAGYTDVRVTGRGPRHLAVTAKGADGKDHDIHVGFDGRVEEFGRP